MKRLELTYRRAGDDADRHVLVPLDHVFAFGRSRTPVLVPMSEVVAVRLLDDEADPPPEKSMRTLHIGGESVHKHVDPGTPSPWDSYFDEERPDAA